MRQHNGLAMRSRPMRERYLTERQFLRLAGHVEEDNMTKSQMIYARFEAFEEELAHCYFLLHERFIANPLLAKFWVETAMDELQHHSIIRFCRGRELMAKVDVDPKTMQDIEELLETVKDIVKDPNVSVDEAFFAALLMESSELEDVYER